MKKNEKITGISFTYNPTGEYDMVHALGIKWMRQLIYFPWQDKMFGTLRPQYLTARQEIIDTHAQGFEIMPVSIGMGVYIYDEEAGENRWHDFWPDFVGEKGTEEYYENVRLTMEFICRDLGESAGIYWQVANEIENPIFAREYSDRIVADTARAAAEGVMRANPNARCGINIADYCQRAIEICDILYREGHCFYYCGVDEYFGSWHPGDVDDWEDVINALYDRYGLPVLVSEWGYSGGGEYSAEKLDPAEVPFGMPDVCHAQKWFHQVEGGHTPEVQAEYLRRGLKLFAENPHCIGSFIFCWRDAYHCYHCHGTTCPSECYWGLVTADCQPKPAYYAVKEALEAYYK